MTLDGPLQSHGDYVSLSTTETGYDVSVSTIESW